MEMVEIPVCDVGEQWRETRFPGIEVSDLGRVRRVKSGRESFIAPDRGKDGHLRVAIFMGAQTKFIRIRRLVCEAFHGPKPSPGAHCRNLNNNPADVRAANLRWG